jgi:hypothetical protein
MIRGVVVSVTFFTSKQAAPPASNRNRYSWGIFIADFGILEADLQFEWTQKTSRNKQEAPVAPKI